MKQILVLALVFVAIQAQLYTPSSIKKELNKLNKTAQVHKLSKNNYMN